MNKFIPPKNFFNQKWRLLGLWKEPPLIESFVCREITSPSFKSVFSFKPKAYCHINHHQFVPQKDFSDQVKQVSLALIKDTSGTVHRMQYSITHSVALLEKFRSTDLSPKRFELLLKSSARMARHWYEIMVIDGALQKLYPASLPNGLNINGQNWTSQQLLAVTALPKKIFPVIHEHYHLLSMASDLKQGKSISVALKSHTAKFSWMNSLCWWGEPFSAEHYEQEAIKYSKINPAGLLAKEKTARLEQYAKAKKVLNEVKKAYPKAYSYIDAIRSLADLKEENWDAISMVGVRIRPYLKKLASKNHLSLNQLFMLTTDEILKLVAGRLEPDIQKLNQRLKHVGVLAERNGNHGIFEGPMVDEVLKKLIGRVKPSRTIKGTIIWQGKVTGRVRIIPTVDQVHTMKPGEILVCPMTDPDYMPALRKAKAVVTNQGGLLCHAAIIARELRIPCIVGTEVATRVLKSGDRVEVDANQGVVRKL